MTTCISILQIAMYMTHAAATNLDRESRLLW